MFSLLMARFCLLPWVIFVAPAAYCVEPSKQPSTLLVPRDGVETTIVASKPVLNCQDSAECTTVLVIDVNRFPESVKGLLIETNSAHDGANVSEKHFKDHDGSGSFLVPLGKVDLKHGYDLKIKPIPRSTGSMPVEDITIDKIGLETLPNHPHEK
ncbi:hypothetical protein DXT77_14565 [Pseudomonas sp. 91RF]|jgi:hypothetical protein|uniref:hypothetical protein n=1 Tax=Pseudomonas sp. 91RF TaxID=2292261 RepID=UPI000E65F35E|nr:hypothetical protein [Pseudomonas sp. 91RF]RIJ09669.1 hypothetical protein DXT77_14565 [Pseudomonas sp. 91RF]